MQTKLPFPPNSFFKSWVGLWPTIESPDTYIALSLMSAFGACLGRQLWFDQDFVKIYPMLNLLLIGPSGLGKSTCLGLAMNMVRSLPPEMQPSIIGPNTKEGLHQELMVHPRAILTASELANFFNKAKYMEAMVPYITELLDYAPFVECSTKGGGRSVVLEPSVTIAGGSTVEWLMDELPDTAGSGGFLPRFFVVVEEHKRQKIALPGKQLSPKQKEALAAMRDVAKITFAQLLRQAPRGAMDFQDYEVAEMFTRWYNNQEPAIGHLEPFVARSRETVLRLSMLMALSCERRKITIEDMEAAINLYEIATAKLAKVAVPGSVEGKLLAQVLKAVGWKPTEQQDIFRALETMAPVYKIEIMLQSHLKSGAITKVDETKYQRTR